MHKLIFFLFIISSISAKTQTVLFEENFTVGIPSTWALVNSDNLIPASSPFNFTDAWIHIETADDTCAASTSFYTPSGQSSDYLITPKFSLITFSKLVWSARSYDASYPDSYLVLISATDSLIGSFTDTLLFVDQENYTWNKRSVQLDLDGYANQDIYIAFKNITEDGYVLMIDDVKLLGSDFTFIETIDEANYIVYPNPAQNQITVSNFKAGDVVSVYSMVGKLLSTSSNATVDVSNLAAGTYLIQVISSNQTFSMPFIKQ